MKRRSGALALLVAAALIAGCGGSDESKGDDDAKSVGTTDTATTSGEPEEDPGEETEPTPEPTPAPAAPSSDGPPVAITSPMAFTNFARGTQVRIAGLATVAEGNLVWAILGSDLKPLVTGRMEATCGAPCRGKFAATIPLGSKVPIGSFELHVWAPNAAGGPSARLHDTLVPITVVERLDPNAAAPDAFPPGGVPQ